MALYFSLISNLKNIMAQINILMVQSNADSIAKYKKVLQNLDCEITVATSTEQALTRIRRQPYHVVITGLEIPSTSGRHGGDVILQELSRLHLPTQSIVITANTQRNERQILQRGAFGCLRRPVDSELLITTIQQAFEEFHQLSQIFEQPIFIDEDETKETTETLDPILGNSRVIQEMLVTVREIGTTQSPVLVFGEHGVGKALVASHIHSHSTRKVHARGYIDCKKLPRLQKRALIEILSYRNGTIILDNLHAITEKTIQICEEIITRSELLNIRLIMTSEYSLDSLKSLYRIMGWHGQQILPKNVQTIWIPPLRQRKGGNDIALIAIHYLNYYSADLMYQMKFSEDALTYLQSMDFSVGNVHELRQLVFEIATATRNRLERQISREVIDKYIDKVIRESRPIQAREIFVSHSSKDKDFVMDLLRKLDNEHLVFWIDHEQIQVGSVAWFDEINKGLEQCDAMLLVVSPDSMSSEEVKSEWSSYYNKKMILPLIYKPVPEEEINYRLRKLQSITYLESDVDNIKHAIINRLRNPY